MSQESLKSHGKLATLDYLGTGNVDVKASGRASLEEGLEAIGCRRGMRPQEAAGRETGQDVLGDCDVCQKHHLLHHLIRLSYLHITVAVSRLVCGAGCNRRP